MIWIIGEYAERIDNADELLESFVEGFHDENTQAFKNHLNFLILNLKNRLWMIELILIRLKLGWPELLTEFSKFSEIKETFLFQVQLQLLTAVVKLFLKRPSDTQQLVQRILSLATQDSDNPDLRDRGYIYWRLLSADPAAAKEVTFFVRNLLLCLIGMLQNS